MCDVGGRRTFVQQTGEQRLREGKWAEHGQMESEGSASAEPTPVNLRVLQGQHGLGARMRRQWSLAPEILPEQVIHKNR